MHSYTTQEKGQRGFHGAGPWRGAEEPIALRVSHGSGPGCLRAHLPLLGVSALTVISGFQAALKSQMAGENAWLEKYCHQHVSTACSEPTSAAPLACTGLH